MSILCTCIILDIVKQPNWRIYERVQTNSKNSGIFIEDCNVVSGELQENTFKYTSQVHLHVHSGADPGFGQGGPSKFFF